jgi:hypothetical protein
MPSNLFAVPLAFFQGLLANGSGTETLEISAYFVEHLPDCTNITEQPINIPLVALGDISTSTLLTFGKEQQTSILVRREKQ